MITQNSKPNWYRPRITLLAFAPVLIAAIAQAAPPVDQLPSLVQETSAQFDLAYRSHPSEGKQRREQLVAVVKAWRAAPRSAENNEQLRNWLRAAIHSSMPGSREALPPMPTFALAGAPQTHTIQAQAKTPEPKPMGPSASVQAPAKSPAVEATPVSASTTTANKNAAVDPFRDDPADSQP